MALAATGEDLWVAGLANSTAGIWQLIAGGEVLATPVPVITDLRFPGALGLAVDAAGRLLVVEPMNRLSQVDPQTGASSVLVEVSSASFSDVALGSSGAVYVTEYYGPPPPTRRA